MASWLRTTGKIAAGIVFTAIVSAAVTYAWASNAAYSLLHTPYDVPDTDFPVPYPLTDAELAQLRAERLAAMPPPADGATPPPVDPLQGVDLDALALQRAVARGKHYVEARYACSFCHGANFGGGVMVDDPMIGRFLGPNITTGKGSVAIGYTPADWSRIVRHGVKRDKLAAGMPSADFFEMSTRELSDIIAYIRTMPPVDNEVAPVQLGPLGKVLMAAGQMPVHAATHPDHARPHVVDPPTEGDSVAFGKHLATACVGCHRANLAGGPVRGGDPSWPSAANLTQHEEGLRGWTFEQFQQTLVKGVRRDGTPLPPPMSDIPVIGKNMKEVEIRAMWTYLQSLPPLPTNP